MAIRKETVESKFDLLVPGFRASGVACGIKKNGRKDMALIVSETDAHVAGVFTKNTVKAAPVLIDIERARKGTARGVVINSGNANACTGKQGYKDALETVGLVEKELGLKKGSILVCSTGVIGVPMPMDRVRSGVPQGAAALCEGGLHDATEAIMTTDAFPKKYVARGKVGGKEITVAGIAKGAGMICPNMATMLAFILTDANIKGKALKDALKTSVDETFNSIIVDNDTSTNDTALLFANGASGSREIKPGASDFKTFMKLVNEVCLNLAQMIVKDGEGATRFIEIEVSGAATVEGAKKAARTIAESFLVKTAFFGGDPNWGRILAALGRSGLKVNESKVDITFNGVPVVKGGLDTGKETEAAAAIKKDEVKVLVNLRAGKKAARVWTSDLNYEYVKINSAYRT